MLAGEIRSKAQAKSQNSDTARVLFIVSQGASLPVCNDRNKHCRRSGDQFRLVPVLLIVSLDRVKFDFILLRRPAAAEPALSRNLPSI
ncbi:hypothetical protein D3C80_866170 [compost metagenome]